MTISESNKIEVYEMTPLSQPVESMGGLQRHDRHETDPRTERRPRFTALWLEICGHMVNPEQLIMFPNLP